MTALTDRLWNAMSSYQPEPLVCSPSNAPGSPLDTSGGEKYRALLEASLDAVFIETIDGRITDCNQVACDMYGYPRDTLLTLTVIDLVPPETAAILPDVVSSLSSTGSRIEALGRRANGQIFPTEVSTRIVDIDGATLVFVNIRDISDIKKTQAALRHSEERFRTAAMLGASVIYEYDPFSDHLEWYGDIDGMLGYDPGEFPRTIQDWYGHLHPEDRDRIQHRLHQVTHSAQPGWDGYYRIRGKDGLWRFVHDKGQILPGTAGRDSLFVGAGADITSDLLARRILVAQNELSAALQTASGLEDGLSLCLQKSIYLANMGTGAIFLSGDGGKSLSLAASVGHVSALVKAIEYWASTPEGRQALSQPEPIVKRLGELIGHPESDASSEQHGTVILVPVEHQSSFVACLALASPDANAVPDLTLRAITAITAQTASWIAKTQAERQLKESDETLRAFFEQSLDALLIVDQQARIARVNPVAEALWGLSRDEIIGKTYWECRLLRLPPEDRTAEATERFKKQVLTFHNTEDTAECLTIDVRMQDSKGLWRDVEQLVFPIKTTRGLMSGSITRDVTEKRRMENALGASEARLKRLTDSMRDIVAEIDRDGTVQYISPSTENILGYSIAELVGTRYTRNVHRDDLPRLRALGRRGIYSPVRYRYKHADGRYIWLESAGNGIADEDGAITALVISTREVTDRVQDEEALRLSEQRFRGIFEGAPIGIVIAHRDGTIIQSNLALQTMLGYSDEEMAVRSIEDLLEPNEQNRFQVARFRNDLPEADLLRFESRFLRKDGTVIWAQVSISAVKDQNGDLRHCVGMIEDITFRKQAEEALLFNSFHDSLTGLYNRAYFEEEMLRVAFDRFEPVSMVSADIDGLKLINDTLGHAAGDGTLRTFAGLLKRAFRSSDVVARIGGDEFAVILPKTDHVTTESICRRLDSEVDRYNSTRNVLPLSVSWGTSTWHGESPTLDEPLRVADLNMYRDKLHRNTSRTYRLVNTLLLALSAKDNASEGHTSRVAELATALGRRLGLSQKEIADLGLVAQIHDLGKVGIPDRILFKPGPLTPNEWEEMRQHPAMGYKIAASSPDLTHVADLIMHHHERWDGTGYPSGQRGQEIPLLCRILALADAYDAMTSDRPYRAGIKPSDALDTIASCAGTQFDPDLTAAFLELNCI